MSLAAEDQFSLAESQISARCVTCFNCCRASCGVSGQLTAVVWCERSADDHRSGVSRSFDDRRPSSRRMTIVVPTKIAWCVPSFRNPMISWQLHNHREHIIVVCDVQLSHCTLCKIPP